MKKIREHNGSRNGTTNAQIIPKWTEPSRVFLYIYIYIWRLSEISQTSSI